MLVLCALAAAALLGYLAVSGPPTKVPGGAGRLLIADGSLPEPRQRVLDELTIEQTTGAARTEFTLQRRRALPHPGFYLSPPGTRADDAEVENLFSALLSTVVERRLDRETARENDGPCRIRVRFGAGHWLCFGAESASGSVYVHADTSPAVVVVERQLFDLLSRPPSHYRTSQMIAVPLRRAQRISLGPLNLFHDGDLWRVQGPGTAWALAEPVQVEELLQRLALWKVRAWPAAQDREPPEPPLRLRIDGEELWRGGWPAPADCPQGTRLFLRAANEPVCADDPAGQKLLPQSEALRAQVLLPIKSAAVQRLQRAPRVDLMRLKDGTYQQSGRPAESTSVSRILALLTTTRAEAAPGSPPPASDAVRLQVTTTLGQKVELALWSSAGESFVQRDQEAPQRLTEPAPALWTLDELTFAPLQLLSLESPAVRRITRRVSSHHGQGPQSDEVVERTAGWQLRRPTAAPVSSAAMATLLEALSDLRALRFIGAAPRPEYGLTPPRVRVEVELGAPESPAKPGPAIELGAPADAGGDCYARRDGSPLVAILPAASCAALTQPLLSPLVLRLDEARLAELQLTQSSHPGGTLSCVQDAGQWRCGGKELAAAAKRTLLSALQALGRSASFTYAAAPPASPQLTLHVRHRPLTALVLPRSTELAAVTLGEEVAPPEQTLRIYPDGPDGPDGPGGWVARLDERGVTYRLPESASAAVKAALSELGPAAP